MSRVCAHVCVYLYSFCRVEWVIIYEQCNSTVHMRLPISIEDESHRSFKNIEFPCEYWNIRVWHCNLDTSLSSVRFQMASGRVWQQEVVPIIPHISITLAIRWNWSHHTIITRFCWISGVPSHIRLVWKLLVLWPMTRMHLVISRVNTQDHIGKQLFSARCIWPLHMLARPHWLSQLSY